MFCRSMLVPSRRMRAQNSGQCMTYTSVFSRSGSNREGPDTLAVELERIYRGDAHTHHSPRAQAEQKTFHHLAIHLFRLWKIHGPCEWLMYHCPCCALMAHHFHCVPVARVTQLNHHAPPGLRLTYLALVTMPLLGATSGTRSKASSNSSSLAFQWSAPTRVDSRKTQMRSSVIAGWQCPRGTHSSATTYASP